MIVKLTTALSLLLHEVVVQQLALFLWVKAIRGEYKTINCARLLRSKVVMLPSWCALRSCIELEYHIVARYATLVNTCLTGLVSVANVKPNWRLTWLYVWTLITLRPYPTSVHLGDEQTGFTLCDGSAKTIFPGRLYATTTKYTNANLLYLSGSYNCTAISIKTVSVLHSRLTHEN